MTFKTLSADRPVLAGLILFWLLEVTITLVSFAHRQGDFHIASMNVAGICLFIAGGVLRVDARVTLGRQFSPNLRLLENHRLITRGIYRFIRHPAYAGIILACSGLPLILGSPAGLVMVPFIAATLVYRIRLEEQMLTERFGDDYRLYARRTKRLAPWLY
jgi:protein-S-isoprenylcysteine O-methyltransferase